MAKNKLTKIDNKHYIYRGYKIDYDNLLGFIYWTVNLGYSFKAGFFYFEDCIIFIDAKLKDAKLKKRIK